MQRDNATEPGCKDGNGTEARAPLLAAADEWTAALAGEDGRPFMGVRALLTALLMHHTARHI